MSLNSGETLQPFKALNQLIFDSSGNLIGIQNDRANGADLRSVTTTTWANRPTTADPLHLYLFTDVGSSGTLMRYANGRWRPLAGQAMLASLGASVSGVTNSETIVLQTLIPAGAWQTNDTIRLFFTGGKSGTTDTYLITVRVGTAGTTADTAITGLSGFTGMIAANFSAGWIFDIKLNSATSAQRLGSSGAQSGSFTSSAAAVASATTITDASANALYVSLSIYSGGATNTVSINNGSILLITP